MYLVDQLTEELDRIAGSAQFNGAKMLTGEFAKGGPVADPKAAPAGGGSEMFFHVGANQNERFNIYIGDMRKKTLLKLTDDKATMDITTAQGANDAVGKVDAATIVVSKQRANLGAYQNRLEHTMRGLAVAAENVMAAESRIRDTDMASEIVAYTRSMILSQASTSMLAQANVKSQSVLKLLQ